MGVGVAVSIPTSTIYVRTDIHLYFHAFTPIYILDYMYDMIRKWRAYTHQFTVLDFPIYTLQVAAYIARNYKQSNIYTYNTIQDQAYTMHCFFAYIP